MSIHSYNHRKRENGKNDSDRETREDARKKILRVDCFSLISPSLSLHPSLTSYIPPTLLFHPLFVYPVCVYRLSFFTEQFKKKKVRQGTPEWGEERKRRIKLSWLNGLRATVAWTTRQSLMVPSSLLFFFVSLPFSHSIGYNGMDLLIPNVSDDHSKNVKLMDDVLIEPLKHWMKETKGGTSETTEYQKRWREEGNRRWWWGGRDGWKWMKKRSKEGIEEIFQNDSRSIQMFYSLKLKITEPFWKPEQTSGSEWNKIRMRRMTMLLLLRM